MILSQNTEIEETPPRLSYVIQNVKRDQLISGMGLRESFCSVGLACLKSRLLPSIANKGKHLKESIRTYCIEENSKEKLSLREETDGVAEEATSLPKDKASPRGAGDIHPGPRVNSIVLHTGEIIYEPQEPGPDDCCGKGCQECVWTQYWDSKIEFNNVVSEINGVERERTAFEIFEERLASQKKL